MELTIILPVYNGARTLDECLKSIFEQDFPKDKFEVLLIDGGSKDGTLNIVKKYPVRLVHNEKIPNSINNEEFKRIWGIKNAKGKVIAFIDADNILIGKDWIKKMLEPFKDKDIAFADTLYFSYRKDDPVGVKYQALIGGDDPFIMYAGAYSRYNYLKKDWTDYPHKDEEKENYLKSKLLNSELIPPMGSNGFLVRTNIAKEYLKLEKGKTREHFIHSDFVYYLIKKEHDSFAKVKTGIIHNQPEFFPNKKRRIERRGKGEVKIEYNYGIKKKDILKIVVYMLLIIPILYDTLKGFIRKPDKAWFFHPIACFGELFIYIFGALKNKVRLQ